VSLPALMNEDFDGRAFRVGRPLGRGAGYTRYAITYRGDDLLLSGLMVRPDGAGPFPVLILNHGYIDPGIYMTGRGFERSQDYLARRGFVVVHIDYRNHAASDDDPRSDLELRLGYATDAINAVLAIKRAALSYIDIDRIGMLGRSMGGGVTLNALVLVPDLVDAAVLFAPVSSDAVDNFNRWIRRPARRALAQRIIDSYGAPRDDPVFWANVSARTFFDRVEVPLQIHHGTADESVPIEWTRETVAALLEQRKDVRLFTYDGEGHQLYAGFDRAMQRTVSFFETHLR